MRFFSMQLKDLNTGLAIITAGGKVYVAVSGSPAKQALVNKDGSALSNPITPTRGKIEFYVASDDTTTVDLYGMAPGGQSFQAIGITASGPNEIGIDCSRRHQVLVIPYSIADTLAATETVTGFKTGIDKMWLPNPMAKTVTLDATETIDVGTDGAGSNDPDGFLAAASVATAVLVKGTLLASGATMGALFSVLDSANAGDDAPEGFINAADEDITYTLSAGTDTARGYIYLPYLLAA